MMKILKSLSLVVAVAAVAGGATYAFFDDKESMNDNRVAAGTLDLTLGGTANLPLKVDNAYPGMKAVKTFTVTNAGSIAGHIQVSNFATTDYENGFSEPEWAVDTTEPGELCSNITVSIKNADDNTVLLGTTLLANLKDAVQGNVALPASDTDTLEVSFAVAEGAGNNIQTDICDMDVELRLVQDVDQDAKADEDESGMF